MFAASSNNVFYWPLADIASRTPHVCFRPKADMLTPYCVFPFC
jgi:hypothetical protein